MEKLKKSYRIVINTDLNFNLSDNANIIEQFSSNCYGDWVAIAASLRYLVQKFDRINFNILEVGCAGGLNVKSMRKFLDVLVPENKIKIYGLDSVLHGYDPDLDVFDGKRTVFIKGQSTDKDVISIIPDNLQFVFIDACHCWLHVYRDLCMFAPKVAEGGLLLLHDTNPQFEGGLLDLLDTNRNLGFVGEQVTTIDCAPGEPQAQVVKGIKEFIKTGGLKDFKLIIYEFPIEDYWGGITVYEKQKVLSNA